MRDTVVFEVGGERFTTTFQTLRRFPDSLLATLCKVCNDAVGTDKPIKIDRSKEGFRWILELHRKGAKRVPLPPNWSFDAIEEELSFYQLPKCVEAFNPLHAGGVWKKQELNISGIAWKMARWIEEHFEDFGIGTTETQFVCWHPTNAPTKIEICCLRDRPFPTNTTSPIERRRFRRLVGCTPIVNVSDFKWQFRKAAGWDFDFFKWMGQIETISAAGCNSLAAALAEFGFVVEQETISLRRFKGNTTENICRGTVQVHFVSWEHEAETKKG